MDRQLLERMIGAVVLIVALVLVVPAILDGPESPAPVTATGAAATDAGMRTVTIRPAAETTRPPMPAPRVAAEPAPAPPEPTAQQLAAAAAAAKEVKPAAGTAAPLAKPAASPPAAPQPRAQSTSRHRAAGWAVQLGSFARRENATRLAKELQEKGFSSYLEPLNSGGRTLHRVRVGPVGQREAAAKLASRLAASGYRGQVVRQPAD